VLVADTGIDRDGLGASGGTFDPGRTVSGSDRVRVVSGRGAVLHGVDFAGRVIRIQRDTTRVVVEHAVGQIHGERPGYSSVQLPLNRLVGGNSRIIGVTRSIDVYSYVWAWQNCASLPG